MCTKYCNLAHKYYIKLTKPALDTRSTFPSVENSSMISQVHICITYETHELNTQSGEVLGAKVFPHVLQPSTVLLQPISPPPGNYLPSPSISLSPHCPLQPTSLIATRCGMCTLHSSPPLQLHPSCRSRPVLTSDWHISHTFDLRLHS